MLSREHLSHICYEAVRALRKAVGQGDSPSWEEADPEAKSVTRDVIERLVAPHENRNSQPAPYYISAEDVHNQWVYTKLKDGWKYGAVFSEENRSHPLLVPYSDLSEAEKSKDKIIKGIVDSVYCC